MYEREIEVVGIDFAHLPKDIILELSQIIKREDEYKDKFGEIYKKEMKTLLPTLPLFLTTVFSKRVYSKTPKHMNITEFATSVLFTIYSKGEKNE